MSSRAIARRRAEEDRRASLVENVRRAKAAEQASAWEGEGAKVYARTAVKRRVAAARERAARDLDARRGRLAALLEVDAARQREELAAATCVTPEERASRMQERARAYKAEKEARRAREVEEQQYRRWLAANPEQREHQSRVTLQAALEVRSRQMAERAERRAAEKGGESQWVEAYKEEERMHDMRNRRDRERTARIVQETRDGLSAQLADLAERRAEAERRHEREQAAFQQRLADDAAAAERARAQKEEDHRRRMEEINRCNADQQRHKREAREREARENRAIVSSSTDAHEREEEARRALKLRNRAEQAEFRAYLAAQREEEARLSAELERLTQAELDKVNRRRDEARAREDLARQQLMREVHAGRQLQLRLAAEARAREAAEADQDRLALEADLRRMAAEQERQAAAERAAAVERQDLFRSQMEAHQRREYERKHRKPEDDAAAGPNAGVVGQPSLAPEVEQRFRERQRREHAAGSGQAVRTNFARRKYKW